MRSLTIAIGLALAASPLSAQTAFHTTLRSHVPMTPCSDVSAEGNLAFIGRWHQGGMTILDVSDPDDASVITTWHHPTIEQNTLALRPLGSDILVLSNETSADFCAIVLDISNPAVPTIVSDMRPPTFPSNCHNLWPFGDRMMLSGYGTGIGNYIVDLSNPAAPVRDALIPTDIHDNTVIGNTLYIAAGFEGSYVYDITTPTAPVQQSFFTSNTPDSLFYSHNLYPIRSTGYVFGTEEISTGGFVFDQGALRVWDVRDPENPVPVWRWRSDTMRLDSNITPHSAYVVGDFMYLSSYQDGLKVFDCSDPTDPVEVGFYDTFPETPSGLFEGCWGVFPFQGMDRLFLSDIEHGFFIVSFDGARKSTIQGKVRNASTMAVIPGATVQSLTAARTVHSDFGGNYVLKTGSGTHTFQVSAAGFNTLTQDVSLAALGTLAHDFLLVPTTVDVPETASFARAVLQPAAPNPFGAQTTLEFLIPDHGSGAELSLEIFDVRGVKVRTLAEGTARPGSFTTSWDGATAAGLRAPAGVYMARLRVGNEVSTRKLHLAK